MFKGYCHISFLTQCYNTNNPKTLLIIKKKISYLRDPARARRNRSIDFIYTPVSPPFHEPSQEYLFVLLLTALLLRNILFLIRSFLLLRRHCVPPHLASDLTISFSLRSVNSAGASNNSAAPQTIKKT
jgi:hypothetical protein